MTEIIRQERSDAVRIRLFEAALDQFASRGFDAASTRDIATAAATHQPQINYHFGSKLGLWQWVIDSLFVELDDELADVAAGDADVVLADLCRRFVRFAARRPELNRIMVHESTTDSPRLSWMVERHIRHRFALLSGLCLRLDPTTVPTTDPVVFYYCMVGASSLMAVSEKEARLLVGSNPVHERVDAHADAVAAMLLGPNPRSLR
jgi:TetR/AcrR family transcriptional regulator